MSTAAETSDSSPGSSHQDVDDQAQSDADLDGLSYEAARAQLIEVVTQLETGGVPLDESLALWEQGERLATVCQRWLDGAQAKIDATRTGN